MTMRFRDTAGKKGWRGELLPRFSRTDPDSITLFEGWTRLTTTPLGEMDNQPLQGFFRAGTQLVTHYSIQVDGRSPIRTLCSQTSVSEWTSVCLVPGTLEEGNIPEGNVPRGSVEMLIRRKVGARWSETIRLRSYSNEPRETRLRIEIGCPIGDVEFEEEMKDEDKVRNEGCLPELSWEIGQARLRYEREFGRRAHAPTEELRRLFGPWAPKSGEPVRRGVDVVARPLAGGGGRIRLEVEPGKITVITATITLEPRRHAELSLEFIPRIEGEGSVPVERPRPQSREHTKITTANSTVNLILAQAYSDLEALELPVFGPEKIHPGDRGLDAFNAGVPRYMGIFSRDNLATAWQAALFSLDYLDAVLSRIAVYRGVRFDSFRDEEPDRIPHERRLNPKAAVGETNREIYYGDVVSTPFWIVTLGAAYNWTGDRTLLRKHAEVLESCIRWMQARLREGNGFLYYAPARTGFDQANRNQAWKDSGDAIVDAEGTIRLPPIAAVEVQAYCYFALLFAAEMKLAMGEPGRAWKLVQEAQALKKRFNSAFWMPERRFFALGLDGSGKPIDAMASNIGHCLGTGLIDADKVQDVVRGLMSKEMFSGWGIRTLSSDNPAFDPFSYHRGSVWPVENATIAAGMAECGSVDEALEVISSQFELATLFPNLRLPEVVGGQERSESYPVPGLYPHANLLQAWSVSAIALEMLVILGIRPVAPLRTLLVKPSLPDWLPWVEVEDLRVGKARVSLRFWRDTNGASHWKVTRRDGRLWVIEQPADLSPQATLLARVEQALRSARPIRAAALAASAVFVLRLVRKSRAA